MKAWSSLLGGELLTWASVTPRLMFGMTVFYRKGAIFAALPRTRCFETPNSVAFKLRDKTPRVRKMLESDPRIAAPSRPDANWITFELESDKDLAGALKWFDVAYHACSAGPRKPRAKR
jgi:alpha-beta hydrolase superfamily lysophospholipase